MESGFKNIVWIASYPKSGNTWFRIVLSNLISENAKSFDINEIKGSWIASSRYLLDEYSGLECSDLTNDEIEELRPKIYRQIALESNELVFLKVHDAWKKTKNGEPLFPEQYTKAAIYLIRNPLDITVSFSYHSMVDHAYIVKRINNSNYSMCTQPDKIYNQVRQVISSWSAHIKSWIDLSGLPVHIIKYEDMVSDPFSTFKEAFEFIGINKSSKEILTAIKMGEFEKLSEMEEEHGFKEKPFGMRSFFRSGKKDTWRDQLADNLVREITESNEEIMMRFGYYPM